MYFDPLTTWIVTLLANGTVLAGEHVSDAEVTQYYKNEVRKSNINLNNDIRRRFGNSSYLADFQVAEIRRTLEYYKNRFEYRYGAVELEPDVQALLIKLFEKYIVEHTESLKKCEETYRKKIATGQNTRYIEGHINEEKTELAFCQQVITAVEEQRRRKKQEEAEKQKAEEQESKSGCFYIIFFVVLIVSIIAFFVDVLS